MNETPSSKTLSIDECKCGCSSNDPADHATHCPFHLQPVIHRGQVRYVRGDVVDGYCRERDRLRAAPPPTDVLSHDALACLWDGYAVLQEVQKSQSGRQRTSAENVSDVLDAVVVLIRAAGTKRDPT